MANKANVVTGEAQGGSNRSDAAAIRWDAHSLWVSGSAAERALLTLASILADIARETVGGGKGAAWETTAAEETLPDADELSDAVQRQG